MHPFSETSPISPTSSYMASHILYITRFSLNMCTMIKYPKFFKQFLKLIKLEVHKKYKVILRLKHNSLSMERNPCTALNPWNGGSKITYVRSCTCDRYASPLTRNTNTRINLYTSELPVRHSRDTCATQGSMTDTTVHAVISAVMQFILCSF